MKAIYLWLALAGAPYLLFSIALAHGPDQPAHQIADLGEFRLEGGGVIKNLRMSYVTHGTLNKKKSNTILVMHGFGDTHHLTADHLIGPGMAFDTDKYFMIASDTLGNTQTGFEHSTSATNSGLGMDFPAYNLRDAVNAEHKLVSEGLGIEHLVAVSGISIGAEKTLQFAVSYPDFMDKAIPIVGGALWSSQVFLTYKHLPMTIENCSGWDEGAYTQNPKDCARVALMTMVPSFYSREWWNENITTPEEFQEWWTVMDDFYLGIQDTRDLYFLAKAVVRTTVAETPGFDGNLAAALGSIQASTLFVISPHDAFVPPQFVDMQNDMIPNSEILSIDRNTGHLICCGDDPDATEAMAAGIRRFLGGDVNVAVK